LLKDTATFGIVIFHNRIWKSDVKRKNIGGVIMSTQIKVTHTFNAPRELVFKVFTESEHLKNWWGPKGWTFEVSKSDFHPGGVFHYSQNPADGNKMWVKFVYHIISTPEKIVYSSFFSNEEGNTVRAPFDPNWPMEILNNITFNEDDGKTTIIMIVEPVSPTEKEIKTFHDSKEMAKEGYSGTYFQLDEYLKKVQNI
jgi:uncharacterized protein YndB with AHSA1/START domain